LQHLTLAISPCFANKVVRLYVLLHFSATLCLATTLPFLANHRLLTAIPATVPSIPLSYSHCLSVSFPAQSSRFVAFQRVQWYHGICQDFEKGKGMKRITTLTYQKYYNKGLDKPDILKDGDEDTTPKAILTEIQKCIEDVMAYHGAASITVTIEESN